MGGEGEVRRKRVEVGLVPRIIPPGVSEVGCRLKGSSSLVEWCWGIVGDRMDEYSSLVTFIAASTSRHKS